MCSGHRVRLISVISDYRHRAAFVARRESFARLHDGHHNTRESPRCRWRNSIVELAHLPKSKTEKAAAQVSSALQRHQASRAACRSCPVRLPARLCLRIRVEKALAGYARSLSPSRRFSTPVEAPRVIGASPLPGIAELRHQRTHVGVCQVLIPHKSEAAYHVTATR